MSLDGLSPEEVERLRKLLDKGDEPQEATPEKQKETVESSAAPSPKKPRKPLWKNKVALLAGGIALMVGLAVLFTFVIQPWFELRAAQNELTQEVKQTAVVGVNDELIDYTPKGTDDTLPGANPKQLALGKDGKATEGTYFEFASEEPQANAHVVDLYIDFYSQRARDFITFNQSTLKSSIASGKVILRVHPVVDKDGFSVFAPEALAEVFGTHPDKAWEFFVALMKNSASLIDPSTENATQQLTNKEIVDFIAKVSADTGVPTGSPDGVDADSIKYLSFFSWLYAGSNDEKLQVGYYPPILYVDDKEINQDETSLSDPDAVAKLFAGLK